MPLELMFITNNPEIARIAEGAGVDRIWIDLEKLGKEERQGGMNSVKSDHTLEDIKRIRPILSKALLQVRVNPLNPGSKEEIDKAIEYGAQVIMLPMFKTAGEVETFLSNVNKRVTTLLLLETREAVERLDDILKVPGIDEIHIGLNDLHLSYGKKFMFELLADGTVEDLCKRIGQRGIPYGFGGIARLGYGLIPAELIIAEHYRLGSTRAILSRSFCNLEMITDIMKIDSLFTSGINRLRNFEMDLSSKDISFFLNNSSFIRKKVLDVTGAINKAWSG